MSLSTLRISAARCTRNFPSCKCSAGRSPRDLPHRRDRSTTTPESTTSDFAADAAASSWTSSPRGAFSTLAGGEADGFVVGLFEQPSVQTNANRSTDFLTLFILAPPAIVEHDVRVGRPAKLATHDSAPSFCPCLRAKKADVSSAVCRVGTGARGSGPDLWVNGSASAQADFTRFDAVAMIETWRAQYNDVRPHSSLAYLTPNEFRSTLNPKSATT